MFPLRNFILHDLQGSFAIGQYKIPLLILGFLHSLVIFFEIMNQMLIFDSVFEVVRVVNMLHTDSVFEGFLNESFLGLFNYSGAIWIYFNLVHVNSMAQSFLTGHDLRASGAWRSLSNITFHRIFTCYFSVKYIVSYFLNGQKLRLLHHFGPLCFIIYCQINL